MCLNCDVPNKINIMDDIFLQKLPLYEDMCVPTAWCNAISHDKFRTILKQKALKYGSTVRIVCEGNTSKTCGACGNVKEIKNKRIYNCDNCFAIIDRDVNGARNILIKHQKLNPSSMYWVNLKGLYS